MSQETNLALAIEDINPSFNQGGGLMNIFCVFSFIICVIGCFIYLFRGVSSSKRKNEEEQERKTPALEIVQQLSESSIMKRIEDNFATLLKRVNELEYELRKSKASDLDRVREEEELKFAQQLPYIQKQINESHSEEMRILKEQHASDVNSLKNQKKELESKLRESKASIDSIKRNLQIKENEMSQKAQEFETKMADLKSHLEESEKRRHQMDSVNADGATKSQADLVEGEAESLSPRKKRKRDPPNWFDKSHHMRC